MRVAEGRYLSDELTIHYGLIPRTNRVGVGLLSPPPVDGRANTAVERLIARALRLPPSSVSVVGWQRARRKTVSVEGMGQRELLTAFAALSRTRSPAESPDRSRTGRSSPPSA